METKVRNAGRVVSRGVSVAAVSAMMASASLALAANVPAQPEKGPTPVFVMDFSGVGSLLVDKKDEALKNALSMLPDRLRELPHEIPGMGQVPAPVLNAVLMLLTQPMRAAVTFDPDRQDAGMFGFGAVVSSGPGDEKQLSQMQGTVNAMLAMGGMAGQGEPSKDYAQMMEIPSPAGGKIRYGLRQGKDGWRYEIHAGSNPDPDAVFAALAAPKAGFTPVVRAHFDPRPVGPMVEQQLENMGADAGEQMAKSLEGMGLIGKDAVQYSWECGYTPDERITRTVVTGMKAHAEHMSVPTEPLGDSIFAMIPSDASVAAVKRVNMGPVLEAIHTAMEESPEAAHGIEQFTSMTGVDPLKDILGCLGGTFGFYMSDSTGGQLASMVAFASLSDRARFEQAHEKLVGFANTMLANENAARGYAKIRSWSDGDTHLFSMAFPGLPVPVEITWALQGDWLVAGLVPQSTLAAVHQIAGHGDKGLRSNSGFASLIPAGRGVGSFMFIDTPRVMKDGYQYVCLFGSAVANLVRSPGHAEREPGLVVPPIADLRRGARPFVSYSYWQEDDYVTECHSDRSMLVNACGVVGAASPIFPLVGAAIGAAAAQEHHGGFHEMTDLIPLIP